MADSWEDRADGGDAAGQKAKLNPLASNFSFNPTAGMFVPGGSFAPAQAAPIPSPPAPTAPSAEFAATRLSDAAPEAAQPATAAPVIGVPPEVLRARQLAEEAKREKAAKEAEEKEAAAEKVAALAAEREAAAKKAAAAAAAEKEAPAAEKKAAGGSESADARRAAVEAALREVEAVDSRDHLNVVFIGHVDAGKSTMAGQILFLTGGVDERTIEKYEREAKEKNRESWYMAYIMDTNEEERSKGKTVEVGRACFATSKRRYTVLDAPGHKGYVPNMISGASQADVGVLVISGRKGEFETGYERGGQTREHAQLAKTLGVSKLLVVVNKMDDPSIVLDETVNVNVTPPAGGDPVARQVGKWNEERYQEIVGKLTPFLRACGYNPKKDVTFLPVSGLYGENIRDRTPAGVADWYTGATLFETLDGLALPARDPYQPFRMPISDRYKDMGTVLMGKSEAGVIRKGDSLTIVPSGSTVKVLAVYRDDDEVNAARPGENLRVRVSGIEEDDVSSGFVLCSSYAPVPDVTTFEAQLVILDLLEHKPILSSGYKAILHLHAATEECEIVKLIAQIDPKTKEKKKVKFVKSGSMIVARISVDRSVSLETFDTVPQLGRFTLRDEGKTIAIGKVLKLPRSKRAGGDDA